MRICPSIRVVRVVIAMAVASLSVFSTSSASASTGQIGYSLKEYTVSGVEAEPCNVQGVSSRYMYEIDQEGRALGRMDLQTGQILKIQLPPATLPVVHLGLGIPGALSAGPCDMTVGGDGNLWFNDQYNNSVGYVSPAQPDVVHEISMLTPASLPMSLAVGADGNIYVTESVGNRVAKVDVTSHQVTEYPVPTPASLLIGGIAGQDGHQWFVEMAANKILSMDYSSHAMREYSIPDIGALPFVIRSYGGTIWFSEFGGNAIGRFDPATGAFARVPIPTLASEPIGLAMGQDGFLYTDESVGGQIARIDPVHMKTVAEYPLPTRLLSFPDEIKMGPDLAIWSPELFTGKLARLWLTSWGPDPGYPQG